MGKIISTDNIADGMVLAEAVTNSNGQVMIPAGAKLKAKHKSLLKRQRILTVDVKCPKDDEVIVITEEMKTKAFVQLTKRLKWTPENDYERDIFHIAMVRAATLISKKEAKNNEKSAGNN